MTYAYETLPVTGTELDEERNQTRSNGERGIEDDREEPDGGYGGIRGGIDPDEETDLDNPGENEEDEEDIINDEDDEPDDEDIPLVDATENSR